MISTADYRVFGDIFIRSTRSPWVVNAAFSPSARSVTAPAHVPIIYFHYSRINFPFFSYGIRLRPPWKFCLRIVISSSLRNNIETIAAINNGKNWRSGILAIEFYLLEHWSMSGNTERSSLSGIVVEVGWASINVRGIMCTCPSNLDEVPRIG